MADAIERAHARIDKLEELLKEEAKGHERRLQRLEIEAAANKWISHVTTAVVSAIAITLVSRLLT